MELVPEDQEWDVFYYGGKQRLRVDDVIESSLEYPSHEQCIFCNLNKRRDPEYPDFDAPVGKVLFSSNRLLAEYMAHLFGAGWLYQVEPVGEIESTDLEHLPGFTAEKLRVVKVVDRAIVMPLNKLRKLARQHDMHERNMRYVMGQKS